MTDRSLPKKISPAAWYMLSVGTFVVPMGIQTVLYPWLITIELGLGATELGIGQMALQLPALFFILIGGFLADRFDAKRMLVALHIVAAFPPLALAWSVSNGNLSYLWIISYALSMGLVSAFSQPARDKLLSAIAGEQIQRTVTIVMGLTFGTQIIGFGIASFADTLGAEALLVIMAVMLLSGLFTTWQLPDSGTPHSIDSGMGDAIAQGLKLVANSEQMRASAILLASISLFYGGTFMVLNPLMVRDIYFGGAPEISLSFAVFMSGTILTSVVLVSRGGMAKPGLGLLVGVILGGAMLLLASFGLPWWTYLAVIFAWGCCGGLAMSMGRTIMQELAPESHRARIMSVLSLANVGSLPFGAALLGFSADTIGILPSFLVAVAGGWGSVLYIGLRTDLAKGYEIPDHQAEPLSEQDSLTRRINDEH